MSDKPINIDDYELVKQDIGQICTGCVFKAHGCQAPREDEFDCMPGHEFYIYKLKP